MTKQDIIDSVSESTGVSKTTTREVLEETIEVIRKGLSSGKTIYLRGLFTLAPVKRAEKKAQYISKHKTIIIPERYIPKAKFSKSLINEMRSLPVNSNKK